MSLVQIDFQFPDLFAKLRGKETEILLFVAANLQTNRGLMFDETNAGRPTPWAPLKYRMGQALSLTGTLRKSWQGNLRGGATTDGIVRMTGDNVAIGTTLAYAPIHNTGGVILPKNKPMLWIPLPNGSAKSANAPNKHTKALIKNSKEERRAKKAGEPKKASGPPIVYYKGKYFLLAKKVTIPRRPMDEWTEADQLEMETALMNKLSEVLASA